MTSVLGRGMILVGLLLVLLGILTLVLGSRLPLGRLPGDLHFGGRNFGIFLPLGTSLLLSIGASLLLNLILRVFR